MASGNGSSSGPCSISCIAEPSDRFRFRAMRRRCRSFRSRFLSRSPEPVMAQDTFVHVLLAVVSAALTGLVTAVGFMAWTRANFQRIEEWGDERHKTLDEKMDKNFETLDNKILANERDFSEDLAGIGGKVNYNERVAARRYHNLTAAVMLAAPADKEDQIGQLLKEEAS